MVELMGKYSFISIVKGIVLYTILIIGIAIISEWLSKRKRVCSQEEYLSAKLDIILDSIKNDIKKEYMDRFKINGNMNTSNMNTSKETFINNYKSNTFPANSEQALLQEASKRIANGIDKYNITESFTNINNGNPQQYPNNNENSNWITQATTSDYCNNKVQGNISIGKSSLLPRYNQFMIDETKFTPGEGNNDIISEYNFNSSSYSRFIPTM